jgi:hypothetical protein
MEMTRYTGISYQRLVTLSLVFGDYYVAFWGLLLYLDYFWGFLLPP